MLEKERERDADELVDEERRENLHSQSKCLLNTDENSDSEDEKQNLNWNVDRATGNASKSKASPTGSLSPTGLPPKIPTKPKASPKGSPTVSNGIYPNWGSWKRNLVLPKSSENSNSNSWIVDIK